MNNKENPFVDLIYINVKFHELIKNAQKCKEKIDNQNNVEKYIIYYLMI